MKKTIERLLGFGLGVAIGIAICILFINPLMSDNPEKTETTLVQKQISVRTPLIRISPQEEQTVTIPLQGNIKLELEATLEEFQCYFLNNKFTNETTDHIMVVGTKNDTTFNWSIYY
jgi:hypothetical protein